MSRPRYSLHSSTLPPKCDPFSALPRRVRAPLIRPAARAASPHRPAVCVPRRSTLPPVRPLPLLPSAVCVLPFICVLRRSGRLPSPLLRLASPVLRLASPVLPLPSPLLPLPSPVSLFNHRRFDKPHFCARAIAGLQATQIEATGVIGHIPRDFIVGIGYGVGVREIADLFA